MASISEATSNLELLPIHELRRLYESYYGHKTTLRGKDTLCRAIARKAVDLHRPKRPPHFDQETREELTLLQSRNNRSVVQNYTNRKEEVSPSRPRSAAVGGASTTGMAALRLRSTARPDSADRLLITTADGKKIPHYMLNNKESGSAWFERCVREMGISVNPPQELINMRLEADTPSGVVPWAQKCSTMAKRMIIRYSAKLCKATKVSHSSEEDHSNQKLSVDEQQKVALAEWKLCRGVERGAVYLYHVWTGVKRSVLESEYQGVFRILSPAMIDSLIQDRKALAVRQKVIRSINMSQTPSGRDALDENEELETVNETLAAFTEGGVEGEGGTNFDEVPYCTVAIDHNNLLQLRVYFGQGQLEGVLGQETAASPYAFRCEAACINVDKWFCLTGPWKNKVIHFTRDTEKFKNNPSQNTFGTFLGKGLIEAFFVDGFCFEKAYTENPCHISDPFQCTVCGSIRAGNNFIYASHGAAQLQRGRYFCAVCKKKVLHVSLSKESRKLRPRWDPTPARSAVDYSSLDDPPGKK